ncbi:DUF6207 family protein [Streptomyces sp. S.PNR 29]|uniref:DUF6207 family protein n=1 Tax=Streptomyces sp. S.PNR 29 TaxID=2973805 RepID=UPI0025B0C749|nr:DUF6207 family protein [Streptomyces sp. S.PNR 29]MDN0200778.1 DUF6207 family protein [Streptomyces sp. S.PNR 29]
MDPIIEAHVRDSGLVVVDVAAADDAPALAFQQMLADRWARATAEHTTRDAGEPGVRLRCYLDLNQPVGWDAPADAPPQVLAEVQQVHVHVAVGGVDLHGVEAVDEENWGTVSMTSSGPKDSMCCGPMGSTRV